LRSFHRTETLIRSEIILYACKIKETANGRRRCACGEARQEVEVVAQGRIEPNGEFDERKRATKDGKDEAQRIAEAEATLTIS
jgi:hypothetical protein